MPDSMSDSTSESPAAQVTALYDRHALAFARLRSQALMERDWLDAFVMALPRGGDGVLDLGCGTGQPIAAELVRRGLAVTGVDGAAQMLAQARAALPGQRWLLADMRHLPPLGPFAGIVAWHSFFHLPAADQPGVLARMAAMLVPGGALMFTSGTERGEAIGRFEGEPLYHSSLSVPEYREVLSEAGLVVLRHVARDPCCGGATVWLCRRLPD